jgi:hypothetical protein
MSNVEEAEFQTFARHVIKSCGGHTPLEVSLFNISTEKDNAITADKMALESVVKISQTLINDPTIREKIKTIAMTTISNFRQRIIDHHTYNAEELDDFQLLSRTPFVDNNEITLEKCDKITFNQPNVDCLLQHEPSTSNQVQSAIDEGILDIIFGSFKSFMSYIVLIFGTQEQVSYRRVQAEFIRHDSGVQSEQMIELMVAASLFLVCGFIFFSILKKYSPEVSRSFTACFTRMFVA